MASVSAKWSIETIHSRSSLENHTRFQTKVGKDQKGPKITPFRAAHTYMAYIREYLPPRVLTKRNLQCNVKYPLFEGRC